MRGTCQAIYSGTKAFLNSFSFALRAELDDSGPACLMPGGDGKRARADLPDTKVGSGTTTRRTWRGSDSSHMRGEGGGERLEERAGRSSGYTQFAIRCRVAHIPPASLKTGGGRPAPATSCRFTFK